MTDTERLTGTDMESQRTHLRRVAELAGVPIDDVVLPEDLNIVANGLRVHLLDWKRSSAPAVVFLHGGSLNAHTWDVVCLSLSAEYRCIAIDLRGHGESEWSPEADYRLSAMAADVEAVISALNLGGYALVGMSLGGLTAMLVASKASTSLRGLAIIDVGPDLHVDGASKIIEFTSTDREMDSVEDFVVRAAKFNPRRDPDLLRHSLRNNLRHLPNGRWTWKWDGRRDRDLDVLAHEHRSLWNVLSRIACPTLVVRAEHSRVFLEEDAAKLCAALPDARYSVVPNSGHTVQGDNPSELLQALRPFLHDSFTRP